MYQPNKFGKLTDGELLELYQRNGDKEFLGAVYNRYIHLIYGVCMKYLKERESAKDAVMDIFEHLADKLPGTEIRDFGRWIYVVARNHCLMALRKKKIIYNDSEMNHFIMESGEVVHPMEEGDAIENNLEKLGDAIEGLPQEQKECITLFYLEEKSYAEIVKETGYDLKRVKSYIQNGKRNLRIRLKKDVD